MNFNLKEAIEILGHTPQTLEKLLSGLSAGWLQCNEGEGTWNTSEVIEHLIEAEKNNWIPRLEFILQKGKEGAFPPFDRYAHLNKESASSIEEKLLEFKKVRIQNLHQLKLLVKHEKHLEVRELLSTWVAHDLTHIAQIVRVMAERYREDVGPWGEYLGILKK
ncbi:DinB family protein [Priestia megaterium]|uniref:DinB family protein n=1 Tax=Priestia megaterium TaxID=1404 RepID=UPI002FFEAAA9